MNVMSSPDLGVQEAEHLRPNEWLRKHFLKRLEASTY